jgi:type II secretory pathway pseudopilin PulG
MDSAFLIDRRSIRCRRRARGFTLVQLLVVIGIVVLLIGLLLPAIVRAYKTGVRTRTEADLQSIANALQAYKTDFGDYPRLDDDYTANGLNQQTDRGARLLCRALIGPGPAAQQAGGPNPVLGQDGADGFGFRVRAGTGGKVWGPYIQADKFTLGGTDKLNYSDATILDRDNNPILYYVAAPAAVITPPPGGTGNSGYVLAVPPPPPNTYAQTRPMYNAFDNAAYMLPGELQFLLGDRNNSGYVEAGESAATTAPFLLWSAGADGIYGRDKRTAKTDDITNFDIPPDLKK